MNFLENLLLSLLAIVCVVVVIIQLMDMRAIAVQDFTFVWFVLGNIIFLTIWYYYINKAKNNLKKQILIVIAGMLLYGVILFSVCEFL